ncbi:hypothetical protein C0992_000527 [Termitomyces sp. T32_za158]|nr:hypothetical protein C0992_000527 [Termitomyces sp. T32_za158]
MPPLLLKIKVCVQNQTLYSNLTTAAQIKDCLGYLLKHVRFSNLLQNSLEENESKNFEYGAEDKPLTGGSLKRPLGLDAPEHPPTPGFSESTPAGNNAHRHAKCRRARIKAVQERGHVPSPRTLEEVVQLSEPFHTNFSIDSMKANHGAYTARNEVRGSRLDAEKEWTEEELVRDFGFEVLSSKAKPLVDVEGRIFAVLAGRPDERAYLKAADEAFLLLMEEGTQTDFHPKVSQHRQGDFPALLAGIMYGKGHTKPLQISPGKHSVLIRKLTQNESIQRLATFGSASFQLWAPNLFKYFHTHMKALFEKLPPTIENLFPLSVFPCIAFNFGGKVRTHKHRDVKNCPFGWCSVLALGNFDPDSGAKLILWEPKLIVRFPHASTINIPSACITHSNTAVQPGDIRISIAQFCPGDLLRWIDNGGCTEGELKKKDPRKYERMQDLKKTRWKEATGAGKSSILNAILDDNVVPTSGMRARTAVVTEVAYRNKSTVDANVSFLSEADWKEELAILLTDLVDDDGNLKRSTDLKGDARIAWSKVHTHARAHGSIIHDYVHVRDCLTRAHHVLALVVGAVACCVPPQELRVRIPQVAQLLDEHARAG